MSDRGESSSSSSCAHPLGAPLDKLTHLLINQQSPSIPSQYQTIQQNNVIFHNSITQRSQLHTEFEGKFCVSENNQQQITQFSTSLPTPTLPLPFPKCKWDSQFKIAEAKKQLCLNTSQLAAVQESSPPVSFQSNSTQITDAEDQFWDSVEQVYQRSSTYWDWEQSKQSKSFAEIVESVQSPDTNDGNKEIVERRVSLILRHLKAPL